MQSSMSPFLAGLGLMLAFAVLANGYSAREGLEGPCADRTGHMPPADRSAVIAVRGEYIAWPPGQRCVATDRFGRVLGVWSFPEWSDWGWALVALLLPFAAAWIWRRLRSARE
jgi:hypothetical protein